MTEYGETSPADRFNRWIAPAIFGAFDGVVTVLGAVFTLTHDHRALVLSGVGLAASGAVSMGAGEYLSTSGPRAGRLGASLVIGLTTGVGTLLPVVPYMVGVPLALLWSLVLCLLVAVGISALKTRMDGGLTFTRAAAQTGAVLALATVSILLCAWATGAVG